MSKIIFQRIFSKPLFLAILIVKIKLQKKILIPSGGKIGFLDVVDVNMLVVEVENVELSVVFENSSTYEREGFVD